jgi:putative redox protein
MVEMKAVYVGDKHCELSHGPSGSTLETDAPKDNAGRGEKFSPTDLLGASLVSCILTTLDIMAEREKLGSIKGAKARVTKEMAASPRRVSRLPVEITMPAGVAAAARPRLAEIAENCPVKHSLSSSIEMPIQFIYPD